jgi:peptidoglycan/LPS O-acetylase OafA/YrhL
MRVNSIQALRAVAALLVVYEHSMDVQIRLGTSWQQKFYHLDNFGCIGVDLFFVISGFIITYVANKYKGFDEGMHFLEKRFFRINPVYYIATAIFLGVSLLQHYLNQVHSENYFGQTISSLMDTILIFPTSENVKSFSPLLIVGWTLSFEWLFYLLFFTVILTSWKRKIAALSGLILILIGIGQLLQPGDLKLQFLTNPIMLEFLLGVLICQIYLQYQRIPVYGGITLLSIGLISYLALLRFGYGNVWYYLGAISGKASLSKFVLWGIPSACIVAGCIFMERNNLLMKIWNNKWLLLAGNASYSIYLIHYSALGLFSLLYRKTSLRLPPDVMIWVQLAVALLISIGFYKLIEKPLLKWLQYQTLWSTGKVEKSKAVIIGSKTIEKIEPVTDKSIA